MPVRLIRVASGRWLRADQILEVRATLGAVGERAIIIRHLSGDILVSHEDVEVELSRIVAEVNDAMAEGR